jgi:hypothetical protein
LGRIRTDPAAHSGFADDDVSAVTLDATTLFVATGTTRSIVRMEFTHMFGTITAMSEFRRTDVTHICETSGGSILTQ